jgi:hypothetical protein
LVFEVHARMSIVRAAELHSHLCVRMLANGVMNVYASMIVSPSVVGGDIDVGSVAKRGSTSSMLAVIV